MATNLAKLRIFPQKSDFFPQNSDFEPQNSGNYGQNSGFRNFRAPGQALFFVRFDKNSIWPKVKELDFWQKLDFEIFKNSIFNLKFHDFGVKMSENQTFPKKNP